MKNSEGTWVTCRRSHRAWHSGVSVAVSDRTVTPGHRCAAAARVRRRATHGAMISSGSRFQCTSASSVQPMSHRSLLSTCSRTRREDSACSRSTACNSSSRVMGVTASATAGLVVMGCSSSASATVSAPAAAGPSGAALGCLASSSLICPSAPSTKKYSPGGSAASGPDGTVAAMAHCRPERRDWASIAKPRDCALDVHFRSARAMPPGGTGSGFSGAEFCASAGPFGEIRTHRSTAAQIAGMKRTATNTLRRRPAAGT
mmetsp:Transcript_41347/g.69588  ORF Transcript_41347/g.69588 Transcript_41347/m.69588 type:complete len:259 (+) Transcript_41347:535-1311(+)